MRYAMVAGGVPDPRRQASSRIAARTIVTGSVIYILLSFVVTY